MTDTFRSLAKKEEKWMQIKGKGKTKEEILWKEEESHACIFKLVAHLANQRLHALAISCNLLRPRESHLLVNGHKSSHEVQ